MTDENVSPLRPERVVTVGGPVDELQVTLALYGEDLDPVEISGLLGCQSTSSHRRGETRIGKKTGQRIVYMQGAWFLSVEGRAPRSADELTSELVEMVSADESVWLDLGRRFDIQMRYGIFAEAWNRGFGLSREVVRRVARICASLEFDIYANLEEDQATPP